LQALWHSKLGPGKSTYTFSAKRLLLSAPRQASVGRASRQGEQKAEDIQRKTYTLINPDPSKCLTVLDHSWQRKKELDNSICVIHNKINISFNLKKLLDKAFI
jgi:hypothetical protein